MPENKRDIDLGTWTLHRAANENRSDIARALIARGADVNARGKDGSTPLHWAAKSNSLDVARLPLVRGLLRVEHPVRAPGRRRARRAALRRRLRVRELEGVPAAELGAVQEGGPVARGHRPRVRAGVPAPRAAHASHARGRKRARCSALPPARGRAAGATTCSWTTWGWCRRPGSPARSSCCGSCRAPAPA